MLFWGPGLKPNPLGILHFLRVRDPQRTNRRIIQIGCTMTKLPVSDENDHFSASSTGRPFGKFLLLYEKVFI